MSWLHQGYTQPVLFLQPETFKIEDAGEDGVQHGSSLEERERQTDESA